MATASAGGGYPVAIIDRNRPVFYCVPAALYEQMLDALDEKDLVQLLTSSRPEGRGFLQRSDRSLTRLGGFLLQRAARLYHPSTGKHGMSCR